MADEVKSVLDFLISSFSFTYIYFLTQKLYFVKFVNDWSTLRLLVLVLGVIAICMNLLQMAMGSYQRIGGRRTGLFD